MVQSRWDLEEQLMPRLSNSPREATVFDLEQRKSASLGIWFKDTNETPINLADSTLTLTIGRIPPYGTPTVLLTKNAIIDNPAIGFAKFDLQASDMSLAVASYEMAITLVANGYSSVPVKGTVNVMPNVEFASTAETFGAGAPPQSLVVYMQRDVVIHVDVSTMPPPAAVAPAVDWNDILNVPLVFPPGVHTHLWADITDKPATFSPSAHTHPVS